MSIDFGFSQVLNKCILPHQMKLCPSHGAEEMRLCVQGKKKKQPQHFHFHSK